MSGIAERCIAARYRHGKPIHRPCGQRGRLIELPEFKIGDGKEYAAVLCRRHAAAGGVTWLVWGTRPGQPMPYARTAT